MYVYIYNLHKQFAFLECCPIYHKIVLLLALQFINLMRCLSTSQPKNQSLSCNQSVTC